MKAAPLRTVRTRRLTRLEYDALIERAVLDEDDPIELLDGRLFFRGEHQGSPHEAASIRTRLALDRAFGPGYHVGSGYPIAFEDESAPVPDVVVLRGPIDHSVDAPPSSLMLVVEIADSALTTDRRGKGGRYARAGLADYWLVNLVDRVPEVYREPVPTRSGRWRYRSVRVLKHRATAAPLAARRAKIRVADLLP